ncbi:MAG: M56 family metallopeptidase [Armatimonadota bacterium]
MNASTLLVVLLQTTICLAFALIIAKMTESKPVIRLSTLRLSLVLSVCLLMGATLFVFDRSPLVAINIPDRTAYSQPEYPVGPEVTPSSKGAPQSQVSPTIHSARQNPVVAGSAELAPYSRFTVSQILALIYGLGLVLFALQIGIGFWSIRRLRSQSFLVTDGELSRMIRKISGRQLVRTPRLYANANVSIPFVTGIFRQEIYVPSEWQTLEVMDEVHAVLEHEISHISASDLKWMLFGRIACIALWFQPFAWLVNRQMSDTTEEICDFRVLDSGISNHDYAKTLLSIREKAKLKRVTGIAIGAIGRESMLTRRLNKIMSNNDCRGPLRSGKFKWVLTLCMCCVTLLSAFLIAQPSKGSNFEKTGSERGTKTIRNLRGKTVFTRLPEGQEWNGASQGPAIEPQLLPSKNYPVIGGIGEFYGLAELKSGAKVSLLYLCQGQNPHTVVTWLPNGMVDKSISFKRDLAANDYFNSPEVGGWVWARLRVTNTYSEKEVDSFRFEGDSKLQTGMWSSAFDRKSNQSEILVQMVPGKPSVGNIKILVPFGLYKILYHGKPNSTYRAVRSGSNHQKLEIGLPQEFDSKEVTINAKDSRGMPLALFGIGYGNMDRESGLRTWGYNFQSKYSVSRIEVLVRDMEVVSFSGIHLQPTRK